MSKQKCTETITTRFSANEARELIETADKQSISVSRLIRERLFPSGVLEEQKTITTPRLIRDRLFPNGILEDRKMNCD